MRLRHASVVSIVDDDEWSRAGTNKLVRSLGFMARDFSSADAFLQSPHLSETSCLISDIQMPGVDGIQLLDMLRAGGHSMPVIFITAFPNDQLRDQALSRGAMCFLTKPVDGATLERHLATAFKEDSDRNVEKH